MVSGACAQFLSFLFTIHHLGDINIVSFAGSDKQRSSIHSVISIFYGFVGLKDEGDEALQRDNKFGRWKADGRLKSDEIV